MYRLVRGRGVDSVRAELTMRHTGRRNIDAASGVHSVAGLGHSDLHLCTGERRFDERTGVRDRGQLGCCQPQHDQPSPKSSACSTHGISIATGTPVKRCPPAVCRPATTPDGQDHACSEMGNGLNRSPLFHR